MRISEAQKIFELIGPKLAAVEREFAREIASDVPLVRKLGEHIVAGGGKRIRPALMLLIARMVGYQGEKDVRYAAMVELIHTATLVHDDIIDEAQTRRGQRSLNSEWGNNTTVLLGDYVYTKSMQLGLEEGDLEVLKRVCATTLRMIEGEMIAFQRNGDIYLSREDYLEIVRRKTAGLFSLSSEIPGMLVRLTPEERAALATYGQDLGMSFQLIDDLLDFTSSESVLGKPVLADLREGKVTLPLILLVPQSLEQERRTIEKVLAERNFDSVSREDVLALTKKYDTLTQTLALAKDYAERAKNALAVFPPSEARDALMAAPDYVTARNH